MVEIRYILETTVQRNIEHSRALYQQPGRGMAKPRTQHVPVRRKAGKPLKDAEEIVRA
jgi:hypothetical protein